MHKQLENREATPRSGLVPFLCPVAYWKKKKMRNRKNPPPHWNIIALGRKKKPFDSYEGHNNGSRNSLKTHFPPSVFCLLWFLITVYLVLMDQTRYYCTRGRAHVSTWKSAPPPSPPTDDHAGVGLRSGSVSLFVRQPVVSGRHVRYYSS